MQKEISKILKRISAEKLRHNYKQCIEDYNTVAGHYTDIGSYDEAIYYHEKALELSKTIGDRLKIAICLRYVGEAKASLGRFDEAIDYIKKYLDLARRENNELEIQRAWATFGRVYLMQAQEMRDSSNVVDDRIKQVAQEAEKRFQEALKLAKNLREQVGGEESTQMISRLLENIGLIKDICGQHKECVQHFRQAIEMCKSSKKLKEDLFRCQLVLASIFRQKNNIELAAKVSEDAIATAQSMGRKREKCEAYIERGLVKLCVQKDFKGAKRTFAQAYLERSPCEEDHAKAIRLTKLAHLISVTYDKIAQDDEASMVRVKLFDKLGDLFVAVNCYRIASEFYRKAFTEARACSRPGTELAKILYSLAETYADDGQFEKAMICYQKELKFRNGNNKEQCLSLIKIAHMCEYRNLDPEEVCQAYEKAYEKAGKDPKLMYDVLKDYVPYMKKKTFNLTRSVALEETLTNIQSYPDIVAEIEGEDDEEIDDDLADEVADIDDVITDDEDNDEVMMIGRRTARGAKKFKPNEVGETPLHEACIKGDFKRVKSLIELGHEVNPRDHAGWIPLHEACNHGHYEIAEYLLENGAAVEVSNRGLKGMSPLHDAATNGHFDIMRLLIKHGANVIALTDNGESVLKCLRDFKERNQSAMKNRELDDCKQMERDLLNLMDRCGYNSLLDAHVREPSTSSAGSSMQSRVKVKSRTSLDIARSPVRSDPVNLYASTIKVLKRKHSNVDEPTRKRERTNLPATFHTSANTSMPTKDWLVKEVVEEDIDDDEPEEIVIEDQNECHIEHRNADLNEGLFDSPIRSTNEGLNENFNLNIDKKLNEDFVESEDGGQDIVEIIPSLSDKTRPKQHSVPPPSKLNVIIDSYRMDVPNRYRTINCLKNSIAKRYEALHGVVPKLNLSPADCPDKVYYGEDLCNDVIVSDLIATITCWELKPLAEVYENACLRLNIKPLMSIKDECKLIECRQYKLDMAYTYWPKAHIKPAAEALAWRDFVVVDLSGATSMLDTIDDGRDVLDLVPTWRKLNTISMKCTGLVKYHFERLCCIKLPELVTMDLSYNGIAFSEKNDFKKNVEKLSVGCPKLRNLNMRKNLLQFAKSSLNYELNDFDLADTLGLKTLKILGANQRDCEVYLES